MKRCEDMMKNFHNLNNSVPFKKKRNEKEIYLNKKNVFAGSGSRGRRSIS
jgi:hypothetical protein